MAATLRPSSGPRLKALERASPSTYSMTIRTPSSSLRVSNTDTMLGWLSEAPSLASRTKRRTESDGLSE